MPQDNLIPDHVIKEILDKTDIVELIGRYVELNHAGTTIKGLCPFHTENTASFTVNQDDQFYYCHGCKAGGDAIKFVQEYKSLDFKEALEFLGSGPVETTTEPPKKKASKHVKKQEVKIKVVPLERDTALEKFDLKTVLKLCHGTVNGWKDNALSEDHEDYRKFKDVSWFPYYDGNGQIDLMVIRFEDQHNKKEVLTFYWDGKNVKMKNYPIMVYGRFSIMKPPNKLIIVHEGEKCVDIASINLPNFVHITWNGGGKKYPKPDWSVLKDREVFLLPDDDKPGIETMHALHLLLKGDYNIDSIEIPIFEKAKKIKKKGADIEEILQCYTPEEITQTILDLKENDEKSSNGRKNTGKEETEDNIGNKNSENSRSSRGAVSMDAPTDISRRVSGAELGITKNGIFTGERQNDELAESNSKSSGVEDGKEIQISEPKKNEKFQEGNNDRQNNNDSINADFNSIQHPKPPENENNDGHVGSDYPFKILGIADDGRAYFLDHTDRMVSFETTQINANMLSDIGTYNYFFQTYFNYKNPTQPQWLPVIDEIRIQTKRKDFDMEKIRGRGAWKDSEGNICYHDGKTTTGKFDAEWTFIRKPKKDIGIFSKHCEADIRREIMNISQNFSFATPADCIRLLSWAVLAPFSGALTWRPGFLLNGESGTGKSVLITYIIKKISQSLIVNGASTTEAAIRQYVGMDSGSTIVEEAESKTPRDRERVEGQFALLRASTSDDSPKTLKGSVSGVATPFEMRQMFGFVAVNASVDNVADDNRIIRINLKQSNNYLQYVESLEEIKKLLTIKNCEGIRSFTWKHLKNIIALSERLEFVIQNETNQSPRYAAGESILLAANLIVWKNRTDELDNPFLFEYVKEFYTGQTQEDSRDETEEMIVKILDHTTLVETVTKNKILMSYRELLGEMKRYLDQKFDEKEYRLRLDAPQTIPMPVYKEYKRIVEHAGLSVHQKERELAIADGHEEIKKVLSLGHGYHLQLQRHKNVISKSRGVHFDGTTKKCTIISGFLDLKEEE